MRVLGDLLLRQRRGQIGIGARGLRVVGACLELVEIGSGGAHLGLGGAQVGLRHLDLLRLRASLELIQLRLGQRQGRLRLPHLQRQLPVIQPRQHVTRCHRVAHLDRHLSHAAGRLESQAHAGLWLDTAAG
jgi:hypothetical protein